MIAAGIRAPLGHGAVAGRFLRFVQVRYCHGGAFDVAVRAAGVCGLFRMARPLRLQIVLLSCYLSQPVPITF